MRLVAAFFVVISVLVAMPARSQTGATLRVTRRAPVMQDPRGDSFILGSVDPGQVLEIIGQQGLWYQVITPPGMSRPRGWIPANAVELLNALPVAAASARPRGRLMIRAFGQASGTRFTASDSFETIVGSAYGAAYGAGAQIVFPNGAFVQGSADRFRKTGSRVLVSGTQIFTLQVPDVVTVTPIQVTAGYRDLTPRKTVGYAGAGLGWHVLREESSPLPAIKDGHLGYHILGGVEYPVWPWLSLAGEIQWAWVPKSLGATGVSSVFKEDDLGGGALRFKVIVGY